jgi:hypothetical protein
MVRNTHHQLLRGWAQEDSSLGIADTRSLGVSLEELLGDDASATKKRGPAPKLQQQIERIQQLPRTQQRFVMQMLDTVIGQASR